MLYVVYGPGWILRTIREAVATRLTVIPFLVEEYPGGWNPCPPRTW